MHTLNLVGVLESDSNLVGIYRVTDERFLYVKESEDYIRCTMHTELDFANLLQMYWNSPVAEEVKSGELLDKNITEVIQVSDKLYSASIGEIIPLKRESAGEHFMKGYLLYSSRVKYVERFIAYGEYTVSIFGETVLDIETLVRKLESSYAEYEKNCKRNEQRGLSELIKFLCVNIIDGECGREFNPEHAHMVYSEEADERTFEEYMEQNSTDEHSCLQGFIRRADGKTEVAFHRPYYTATQIKQVNAVINKVLPEIVEHYSIDKDSMLVTINWYSEEMEWVDTYEHIPMKNKTGDFEYFRTGHILQLDGLTVNL